MKKDEFSTLTKLIESAKFEFAKNGFHKTTVESITKKAGVAKGTYYIYFKTKEDVIRYMVNEMTDRILHILEMALNTIRSGIDDFNLFLKSVLTDTIAEYINIKDIMITVINSNYALSEELTSFKSKNINRLKDKVLDILKVAKEKGYLRDVDIKIVADALFLLMMNFTIDVIIKQGKRNFKKNIESIADFILYGILKEVKV